MTQSREGRRELHSLPPPPPCCIAGILLEAPSFSFPCDALLTSLAREVGPIRRLVSAFSHSASYMKELIVFFSLLPKPTIRDAGGQKLDFPSDPCN